MMPRARRVEMLSVRTTLRKLLTRIRDCFARLGRSRALPYQKMGDVGNNMKDQLQQPPPNDVASRSCSSDCSSVDALNSDSWHVNECDVVKLRVIGAGAFGDVWEGILKLSDGRSDKRVAIKVVPTPLYLLGIA